MNSVEVDTCGEEGDGDDSISPDDISSASSEVGGSEDDKVDGDDDNDIGDDPQWPLIAPIWLNVEKHPSEAFDESKVITIITTIWNDIIIIIKTSAVY